MTLPDVWVLFRRSWWLLALGVLLGGLAGFGITKLQTRVYRASATVLVVQSQRSGAITLQDIQASQGLTRTYATLATSAENLALAAGTLGDLRLTGRDLERRVSAVALRDTQLVEISAEDQNAQRAARVANAVAEAFPNYVKTIGASDASQANLLDPVFVARRAIAPTAPVRPSLPLNAALGTFGGLAIALLLSLVKVQFDDRVRSRADLAPLDVPVLGSVAHASSSRLKLFNRGAERLSPTLFSDYPHSAFAESFRRVQASLAFPLVATGAKVVVVTSAEPGEGKTVTTVNLALALAESGKRVLIIDGDLRKPDVHSKFGLPNGSGLSTGFLLQAPLSSLFIRVSEHLHLLLGGQQPPNPSQMIASPRMEQIVKEMRDQFDIVLIDTAPISDLADTILWLAHSDGAIVVTRAGRTRTSRLLQALEAIAASTSPLIGVILNDSTAKPTVSGYYYSGRARQELEWNTDADNALGLGAQKGQRPGQDESQI